MSRNYVQFDIYDDKEYKVKSEHGFANYFDLLVGTDEIDVCIKMHKDQAFAIYNELKDKFEFE